MITTMRKCLFMAMLLICSVATLFAQSREGLTEYKLVNGLTVMLWEDHDQPDVTGYVVVRAGAVDEPAEYTGLAHYLEHMLFKGTEKIGEYAFQGCRNLTRLELPASIKEVSENAFAGCDNLRLTYKSQPVEDK